MEVGWHNSIIYLWPREFWCHMHQCTPLCSNMVFVMDKLWLVQKSSNRTRPEFRLERPFLPVTPFKIWLSLPTCALKSPSRTTESQLEHHPAPLPETPKRLGALRCYLGLMTKITVGHQSPTPKTHVTSMGWARPVPMSNDPATRHKEKIHCKWCNKNCNYK